MSLIRQALLKLNVMNDQFQEVKSSRKLAALAGKLARGTSMVTGLRGLLDVARFHDEETSTWVTPETLREAEGVPFDACDIRHWMVIADMAGVPSVEGREILSLTEEEMGALSGVVKMPEGRAMEAFALGLEENADEIAEELQGLEDFVNVEKANGSEALEKLYEAMDEVPEGWMVRFARSGGSELKALAGAGVAGDKTPEVRFGSDLEVGAGLGEEREQASCKCIGF